GARARLRVGPPRPGERRGARARPDRRGVSASARRLLIAATGEHWQARIARVGGIIAGAPAQVEHRAARVLDDAAMAARFAQADPLLRAVRRAQAVLTGLLLGHATEHRRERAPNARRRRTRLRY